MGKTTLRLSLGGGLFRLLLISLALIPSASAQQAHRHEVSVYVPSATGQSKLLAQDFELRIDGEVKNVVSAERSKRPLAIVLLFLTNTSGCVDSLAPFSSVEDINKVFDPEDQIAVVVSDGAGTVVSGLSDAGISLSGNLTEAIKIANRNSSDSLNLESGMSESKQGVIFAMKGLQTAIRLLDDSSETSDRVIVLVNDLQNTRQGTRDEARAAFASLAEKDVSVSWLSQRGPAQRSLFSEIPYGSRDFFFSLPDLRGGTVRECQDEKEPLSVVWGRAKTQYYSFENDLKAILAKHRERYRLKFVREDRSGSALRIVNVSLKTPARTVSSLIYPKAIKY